MNKLNITQYASAFNIQGQSLLVGQEPSISNDVEIDSSWSEGFTLSNSTRLIRVVPLSDSYVTFLSEGIAEDKAVRVWTLATKVGSLVLSGQEHWFAIPQGQNFKLYGRTL